MQDVRNFRSNLYVVADEAGAPQPAPLQGAAVAFSRNGVQQGVAFRCDTLDSVTQNSRCAPAIDQ